MYPYFDITLRMVVACILGGAIGLQREKVGRPAGLRTHILVSVSAALVMILSEYVFDQYFGRANLDPARLGAQVISGIGFLGAGTIIRDGVTIKGLTTAASLWAVACVGLAAGAGMYWGAIIATLIIYLTLFTLKALENYISQNSANKELLVCCEGLSGIISPIEEILKKHAVHVYRVDFYRSCNNETMMRFFLKFKRGDSRASVMEEIAGIHGVKSVKED